MWYFTNSLFSLSLSLSLSFFFYPFYLSQKLEIFFSVLKTLTECWMSLVKIWSSRLFC
jgi:hypothetical protein